MSRLADGEALRSLQNFFGYHLGEQHHAAIDIVDAKACPEATRMSFLPMLFGLMPVAATFRASPYLEVKPLIIRHLLDLGVEPSPVLVAIVKDLCDNFDRTRLREGPAALRPRKNSIGDLRAQPDLYKRIRDRQGVRCAVCGTLFSAGAKEETLDHVVPWRLGGDPPGGWNWQLLCRRCNNAKDTLLAAYATPEFSNWIFPDLVSRAGANGINLNERGRYVALRHFTRCQAEPCTAGHHNSELFVVRKSESGFSVFDHLTVVCEHHAIHFGAQVG